MNIRFLETFVWLAKLENFRLTAEKLHTTQAAVSSRIASLEEAFDVRLFDRNTRSATLTPAGAACSRTRSGSCGSTAKCAATSMRRAMRA